MSTSTQNVNLNAGAQHLVLLGDSIFDNALYVSEGDEVLLQLRSRLGPRHQASLLARDGDVLADVPTQLKRLHELETPATWLIVSCGGNDVLGLVSAMQSPVGTVLEAAEMLATWRASFQRDYRAMLDAVLAHGRQTAVATIYDGVPGLSPGLRTALAAFNDVILREAAMRRLAVLDLRLVCAEAADYAPISPIEPSANGAAKIAAAIARMVKVHDPATPGTLVYGPAP